MQLCVPLRIVFGVGVAEIEAIGVGVIVAERPCGEFNIVERWLKPEGTDQFSTVEYRELQVSFFFWELLSCLGASDPAGCTFVP
jgi:hypothetical protein